jgi:cyclopropane-fatty-acyl-phospholipid synthase
MSNVTSAITSQATQDLSAPARKIADLLASAGIRVNGSDPWDIQVRDERFFQRALAYGSLGGGESFMDGWWDADALDVLLERIERADLPSKIGGWLILWLAVKGRVFNRQSRSRSSDVAETHYDLGNDLYEAMLDSSMQYTCAYWKNAADLNEAQLNKLELICRKLGVSAGMSVLELGGGFGGLAHYLAREYGCRVVTYNISREQVRYARSLCQGLPVRVEEKDYREAAKEPVPFDRVVAIGLCEHIGHKNYRGFMELAHRLLKPCGLFLLHTIGGNASYSSTDAWINKYIFPNGMIPSIAQLGRAMEHLWVVEDWHNFGPDYDRTLMSWWSNFNAAWPKLRDKYGERFYRMWKFYLMSSAAAFRTRRLQLWQLVLSKGDIDGYVPVR